MKASLRVLVVDDDADLCDMVVRTLAADGMTATAETLSERVLPLLAQRHFDAIVLDVMMPPPTGMDLLAEIRQRGDETPVLLHTAAANGVAMSAAIGGVRHHADGFLRKPCALDTLTTEVRRVVDEHRQRRQKILDEEMGPAVEEMHNDIRAARTEIFGWALAIRAARGEIRRHTLARRSPPR